MSEYIRQPDGTVECDGKPVKLIGSGTWKRKAFIHYLQANPGVKPDRVSYRNLTFPRTRGLTGIEFTH